jgi:hypothetical protein
VTNISRVHTTKSGPTKLCRFFPTIVTNENAL